MCRMLVLSMLVLLAWVTLGSGRPVGGPQPLTKEIIEPYGRLGFTVRFKAGEPATVIASGDQRTYLGLYIYDQDGNCVAWDDMGDKRTRDDLAVQWHPLETGLCTVEIRNFGPLHNVCQIAFR